MQFEKKRNWQKKMYSRETNNFHVLSDDRLVHSPSALIIFIQMNHTYNIDINNNYSEVEDDLMHLLVQDGNGSAPLTQSQKASLFDKIFDQSSASAGQEESETPAEVQYVFESESSIPTEEQTEETASVPR